MLASETASFERYRMEADLATIPSPVLQEGFLWVPWHPDLIQTHAEVLYACFCQEIDAALFANLRDQEGCFRLMRQTVYRPNFLPRATWLLANKERGVYGAVQGVRERTGIGAVQNLGILPAYRGRGLGTQLLLQALQGMRQAGLRRASLDVTAMNESAVRLYRRLGFQQVKVFHKAPDRF